MTEINDLIFDDLNFNKGTFEGGVLMEQSLKKLKAGRSILIDKDNRIIAGNKTTEIAKKLGYKIRVIETTGDELVAVKRTDLALDSKEGRELALADNSTTHINLSWDENNLEVAAEMFEGFDASEYGVDLDRNAPTAESQGEINVGTFSTDQTLSIKLSPAQYIKVIEMLQKENHDMTVALLTILGYYA